MVEFHAIRKSYDGVISPSLILTYGEEMYSIPDPLTKIPKYTEWRGLQVTQELGFRVIYERPWSYI